MDIKNTLRFPSYCLIAGALLWGCISHATPLDVASLKQPFSDRSIIENIFGDAKLRLGQPIERNVILNADQPWEGQALFISSVYRHNDLYHMLYRGTDTSTSVKDKDAYLCIATSQDGIHWNKPNLGIVESAGVKNNNITGFEDGTPTTWMLTFYDPRPGVPENERVKGIDMRDGERRAGGLGKNLVAHFYGSPDGKLWRKLDFTSDLRSNWLNAFDGGGVFWSEAEQQFVGYFRWWDVDAPRHERSLYDWMIGHPGVRSVFRTASKDLKVWSEPVAMDFEGAPSEHIYASPTHPYPGNPYFYIVLANRFNPGQRALSLAEERALKITSVPGNEETPTFTFASDANDIVIFTTKAGSFAYDRPFLEAFIRPGAKIENWSSRNNFPALSGGLVETGPAEISFYITRHHLQPSTHIQRISLRKDGFASVNAPYNGGGVLTKPFTFTGDHLRLNFSTSGAGEISVELQDIEGNPLPGFSIKDCDPLVGDRINGVVSWRGKTSVAAFVAKPVRLRFEMVDADLYAFRFPTSL